METNKTVGIAALIAGIVITAVLMFLWDGGFMEHAFDGILSANANGYEDQLQYGKNVDIWFMLMMVAFLMIFIRKYEWGVCLAVLLSAAGSFIVYLGIEQWYFNQLWDQTLMIRGVICAITVVIAIGVFLGTVKNWQYLFCGGAFAIVYALIEWLILGGLNDLTGMTVIDTGGSILVHMCAAYFGIGCALGIRDKSAFNEPMYTTTHSVTFVWLASMVLWVLWPSFVTSLIPWNVAEATITCYMAGIGSVITAWAICTLVQGKVNPLVYTYAMLGGPVAIGAPLLAVGPWGALLIGLLAGALSALCFIYLAPVFNRKLGIMDMMGVHNLHGVCGVLGAVIITILSAEIGCIVMAVLTIVITIATGWVIGFIMKLTRGEMELCSDDADFIKNEDPATATA